MNITIYDNGRAIGEYYDGSDEADCNHVGFKRSWVPSIIVRDGRTLGMGQALKCHNCGEHLKEKAPDGTILEVEAEYDAD